MKLKISKESREKYSAKDQKKIDTIIQHLLDDEPKDARNLIINYLGQTKFKTKFGEPEKDLTKFLALEITANKQIAIETLTELINLLWEVENSSVREIGSFIMGKIYGTDADRFFPQIIEIAKLSKTWNDIDNWAGYTIEEHAAKEFDDYCTMMEPLISNENKWVRRLAIVTLGRAFFINKNKEHTAKCLKIIEPSFTDDRKIVRDANSWIVGTLGFRVFPAEVVKYFEKYRTTKEYSIIKLFCDVVRRSKKVRDLPEELQQSILETLNIWKAIDDSKIQRTVDSAINFMKK